MSGQTESTANLNGHAVQTDIQEGQWLSLKEAAEKTGLSQKTLRRYVKKKTLRTRRLGKSTNSPIQVLLTDDLLDMNQTVEQEVIEEATVELDDSEDVTFDEEEEESDLNFSPESKQEQFDIQRDAFRVAIDECLKPLISRIEEQSAIIMDKERQLKLLPDLEKQAREKEEAANLKAFENEALKKQLELLREEKESAEKIAQLSESVAKEREQKSKELEEELENKEEKAEQIEEDLKAIQKHYADLEEENLALKKEMEEKLRLEEEAKNKGFWSWFLGGKK